MFSRKPLTAVLAIAGLWLAPGGVPVKAHHAFSTGFDARKPINFTGKVVQVEWVNPHSWFHIEVMNPKTGKPETWMIEAGNPHNLSRRGFSKDLLKVGMVIKVDGYASKDGTKRANGRDLTLPDGQTVFVGTSGTGAPIDGKDPAEK